MDSGSTAGDNPARVMSRTCGVGGLRSSWSSRKSAHSDCLQSEWAERRGGEVSQVGGDNGIRAAPDRCRDDVPVVLVGQQDSRFEFFPAGDQRVTEGLAHAREALADVDARVDLLYSLLRL